MYTNHVKDLVDTNISDGALMMVKGFKMFNVKESNQTISDGNDLPSGELMLLLNTMDRASLANLSAAFDEAYAREHAIRNAATIIAFSLIFVVSLVGNLMVCYIIATNKRLHSIISCFIINLSISDLLQTVINQPFGLARILLDQWPFGNILCKCLPFIQATSVYVSTITMCIISIDRYYAVVHPLGMRIRRPKTIAYLLLATWSAAFTLALPFAYYNQEVQVNMIIFSRIRCRALYPSDEHSKWITSFAFATQYAIPLTIASVSYATIGLHLRGRGKLGAMTVQQQEKITKINKQTIKMLVIVLISFAISWAPLHAYYLYVDFFSSGTKRVYGTEVFIVVYWFAMASSCHNAFIYSMRNRHFRYGMRKLLPCIGGPKQRPGDTRVTTSSLRIMNSQTMI